MNADDGHPTEEAAMSEHDETTVERVAKAHPNYSVGTGGRRCEGCNEEIASFEGSVSDGWNQHLIRAALDAMGLPSREQYHDGYECPEGTHCVGELRHELLLDGLGEPLPDSSPVEFVLTWNGEDYPLTIQGGGSSEMRATIDLSFADPDAILALYPAAPVRTVGSVEANRPGYWPSINPREVAVMRIMLRGQGVSWEDEHSDDASTFSPEDMAYMQMEARDYIRAVDLVDQGATPEQVEGFICRAERLNLPATVLTPAPREASTVTVEQAWDEGYEAGKSDTIWDEHGSVYRGADVDAAYVYPHENPYRAAGINVQAGGE